MMLNDGGRSFPEIVSCAGQELTIARVSKRTRGLLVQTTSLNQVRRSRRQWHAGVARLRAGLIPLVNLCRFSGEDRNIEWSDFKIIILLRQVRDRIIYTRFPCFGRGTSYSLSQLRGEGHLSQLQLISCGKVSSPRSPRWEISGRGIPSLPGTERKLVLYTLLSSLQENAVSKSVGLTSLF